MSSRLAIVAIANLIVVWTAFIIWSPFISPGQIELSLPSKKRDCLVSSHLCLCQHLCSFIVESHFVHFIGKFWIWLKVRSAWPQAHRSDSAANPTEYRPCFPFCYCNIYDCGLGLLILPLRCPALLSILSCRFLCLLPNSKLAWDGTYTIEMELPPFLSMRASS